MKNFIKFIPCFIVISFAFSGYMYAEESAEAKKSSEAHESSAALESKGNCASCARRAFERALEINAAIDQTFPLLVPATAVQGSAAFTRFFAENGVFQFPGGIFRGKQEIFQGFLAYAQNPGEMNQHVITRKTYWDPKTATLVVERTWFATVTVPTNFCGTILNPGETYSQDDCVVIRFACKKNCRALGHENCVLPGKVVYYHEYFDTCQFQSDFTDVYPAPCQSLA
jgi:hypothetical protein